MPVSTSACLAAGLPDNSRCKRALTEQPYDLEIMLLAAIADRLSILIWQGTKDAQKGKNKPQMILDSLTQQGKPQKVKAFATPEAFEVARQRLYKRGKRNGKRTGQGIRTDNAER